MRTNLVPAYGRDYKSKREVIEALKNSADFRIEDISNPHDGRYVNLPQLREAKFDEVNVRYKNKTMVVVVKVASL